jgi:hypothetical protein
MHALYRRGSKEPQDRPYYSGKRHSNMILMFLKQRPQPTFPKKLFKKDLLAVVYNP